MPKKIDLATAPTVRRHALPAAVRRAVPEAQPQIKLGDAAGPDAVRRQPLHAAAGRMVEPAPLAHARATS